MFNNTDLDITKYLGWFEKIIDLILKLLGGFSSSKETTTAAPETTTVAE